MMKSSEFNVIAVKTIIKSIVGLCTMPFLAVVMQYIDSVTGFSTGQGYHTDSNRYIFENPLVYIFAVLCINILCSSLYLIYSCFQGKNGSKC